VQRVRVGNGQHRANRRFDPVGLQQLAAFQPGRTVANEVCNSTAEAAIGLVPGLKLRLDHGRSGSEPVHAAPQAA